MGLVESALAMPPMIERHGDKGIPFAGPGMLVKGLGEPSNELALPIILIAIFEADDGIEDLSLGAITGARPFEMPFAVRAVSAKESGVVAFERGIGIAALLAKGALDPHRLIRRGFRPREGQIQRAFAPFAGELEG